MVSPIPPIAVILGRGSLGLDVINSLKRQGRPYVVLAVFTQTPLLRALFHPHLWVRMGSVSKTIEGLRAYGVKEIVMAGRFWVPSIVHLKTDSLGTAFKESFQAQSLAGDDALLRLVSNFLTGYGFTVLGVQDIAPELLIRRGIYGTIIPTLMDFENICLGFSAVQRVGLLDIAQSIIVQQKRIIAVEGIEGTDALLKRTRHYQLPKGGALLIKFSKPMQDERFDLPTIGLRTLKLARAARLRGIVVESDKTLFLNKASVLSYAHAHGLFLLALSPADMALDYPSFLQALPRIGHGVGRNG